MFFFKKGLVIIIGSVFLATGINVFLAPNKILDGGFIGVSLIFNYLFKLKIGLTILVLSVPIFWIAWFKNRTYFYNSLHGLMISSFLIDLFKPLRFLIDMNAMFSSFIGGVLVGLGTGLMLRFEISTSGTDLLALFLSKKIGINVGIIIFAIDSVVITMGGLLISGHTFMLSIITITAVGITTSLITGNRLHT
ncbi:YitT family protein [Rummeliibacillus sp. SL167]|uniref:YitT family protein n=1 Tax=Rummeliibacillus sp. SL167 TaxID=2579792 RepID=UPI0011B6F06E|nr:YitT family protein [Rummeliibacillus sp. SL167]